MQDVPTVDASWVTRHLLDRGLVQPDDGLRLVELAGGVSGEVFDVRTPTGSLVVKRALRRLRGAQPWHADPDRIAHEGRALRLAAELVPGRVPDVIDLDEDAGVLVIERAPEHWREWRTDLFAGQCDPRLAVGVGEALAAWHRRTTAVEDLRSRFSHRKAFVQLRLDPFHRTVAAAHPTLAGPIGAVVDRLATAERCLVHGDLSPKNVLQADGELWVLDWEVAHLGDPVFDLAFLVTHLSLKALHRPADAQAYRLLAARFLDAYAAAAGPAADAGAALSAQVGCLLLARVDGKSPAVYLTPDERVATRRLGTQLVTTPPSDVLDLWELQP